MMICPPIKALSEIVFQPVKQGAVEESTDAGRNRIERADYTKYRLVSKLYSVVSTSRIILCR